MNSSLVISVILGIFALGWVFVDKQINLLNLCQIIIFQKHELTKNFPL